VGSNHRPCALFTDLSAMRAFAVASLLHVAAAQVVELQCSCFTKECGCPGANSRSLRGTCGASSSVNRSACASSALCEASGGVWCGDSQGEGEDQGEGGVQITVTVNTPEEFNVALQEVVSMSSCAAKYEVSSSLFGTTASYNTQQRASLGALGGGDSHTKPLAWLAGPNGLSSFLNDAQMGCCAAEVTSLQDCFCRIAVNVGLVDPTTKVSYLEPVPLNQYVYVVVKANVTNHTSAPGSVGALVPTWTNLLGVMGSTFAYTLDTAEQQVQACSPTPEVRQELSGSSYAELFKQHQAEFEALGATAQQCKIADPEVFRSHAGALCTNPVIARLYLCTFLEANPLFEGTGLTSGGVAEYVTIPNPSIASLQHGSVADATVLNFTLAPPLNCMP